jgi:hypothetical protein
LIKVIWPELICIQDQAVVLVACVLGVPDGVVVFGDVHFGVVEIPLAVARVGNTVIVRSHDPQTSNAGRTYSSKVSRSPQLTCGDDPSCSNITSSRNQSPFPGSCCRTTTMNSQSLSWPESYSFHHCQQMKHGYGGILSRVGSICYN